MTRFQTMKVEMKGNEYRNYEDEYNINEGGNEDETLDQDVKSDDNTEEEIDLILPTYSTCPIDS